MSALRALLLYSISEHLKVIYLKSGVRVEVCQEVKFGIEPLFLREEIVETSLNIVHVRALAWDFSFDTVRVDC